MRAPRRRRSQARPAPWRSWGLATRDGRRSPTWCWEVKNAGGDVARLTGLQRSLLSWINAQHAHGRHRWVIRDAAADLGCAPSSVSRGLIRLRSLSLVGGRRPIRGRFGHAHTWTPSPVAAARDRAARRDRWPTQANVATLNTYGVTLTREGLRRAFRTAGSGRPPGPRPPGGGPAAARSPRARGRAWPPRWVDETCPLTGHRERLPLRSEIRSGDDLALVFAGRGARCRRGHAAGLVLVMPRREGPVRLRPERDDLTRTAPVAARVTTPERAAAAAELLSITAPEVREDLALTYLGFRRQPLHEPVLPAVLEGDPGELDQLVADLERRSRIELALVRRSRELVAP